MRLSVLCFSADDARTAPAEQDAEGSQVGRIAGGVNPSVSFLVLLSSFVTTRIRLYGGFDV